MCIYQLLRLEMGVVSSVDSKILSIVTHRHSIVTHRHSSFPEPVSTFLSVPPPLLLFFFLSPLDLACAVLTIPNSVVSSLHLLVPSNLQNILSQTCMNMNSYIRCVGIEHSIQILK